MDELINKYVEKFGENFPLYMFMGVDENEIIIAITKCINDNKPYVADNDKDILF